MSENYSVVSVQKGCKVYPRKWGAEVIENVYQRLRWRKFGIKLATLN